MQIISSKSKYKKTGIYFLIIMLVEFLCYYFRHSFNTDIICIILFCVLYFIIFLHSTEWMIKYIRILVWSLGAVVGVFICENVKNLYLYEIDSFSSHKGSIPLLTIFFTICAITLFYHDKSIAKYKKTSIYFGKNNFNLVVSKYVKSIIFLIGLFLFIKAFPYPSSRYNIGKQVYAKIVLKEFSLLPIIVQFICPLLLIPFLKNTELTVKRIIKEIIIPLTPFLLYCVWSGNKFGVFFRLFSIYAIPISGIYMHSKKRKLIIIKTIFMMSILLLSFLIIYYISTGVTDIYTALFERAAQQGQLWWKIFGMYENKGSMMSELMDEIKPIFSGKDDYYHGIYKVMYLTTPANIVNAKLSYGTTYSTIGIELVYYYFRDIGVIISAIVFPIMYSILTNLYVKTMLEGKLLETIIYCRLSEEVFSAFSAGLLSNTILSIDSIFLLFVLIISNFIYKFFEVKKNNKRIFLEEY